MEKTKETYVDRVINLMNTTYSFNNRKFKTKMDSYLNGRFKVKFFDENDPLYFFIITVNFPNTKLPEEETEEIVGEIFVSDEPQVVDMTHSGKEKIEFIDSLRTSDLFFDTRKRIETVFGNAEVWQLN